jgi:hypothetical protein
MRPIATVPMAISDMVRIRAVLRPFLSPIQPMTIPPMGRAMKPRPKAAKVSSSAATSFPGAKKFFAMIVAR